MRMPIPIVLDTDIGTDIDDAYALVFAAMSPELDLRGVTTVNNDARLRAAIAIDLLRRMGRTEVPIAMGASDAIAGPATRGWMGHEGRGIDLACIDVGRDAETQDAVSFIADAAKAAHNTGQPLTLVTIGALTNAALLIRDRPAEAALLHRIVAMASNFVGFGAENARGEHNVACDADALQVVLESGVEVLLIGLNVTRQTSMSSTDVERIDGHGGPLAEALCGMHRVWFDRIGRHRSPMHDSLAVAAVFDETVVHNNPVHARVVTGSNEPGAVEFNPVGRGEVTHVRVATQVDCDRFHPLFFDRVERGVLAARQQGG